MGGRRDRGGRRRLKCLQTASRERHVASSNAGLGERRRPGADDLAMVYEHYHRYLFAAALAPGRRVLDLAAGEGYGAALLANQADEVVAVDVDRAAVEHAQAHYRSANLSFIQGDMLELSELEDGSFDLITCFEALEHVDDHDRLIGEVLRLPTPHGLLLLSTPDRVVYSIEQGRENPFHAHEVSRDELTALYRWASQRSGSGARTWRSAQSSRRSGSKAERAKYSP